MRSGELFAGVGGLGMAVDEVFGSKPAWFAEFDTAPSKVLAYRHPDIPNYGDVTAVDWTTTPRVNVMAAGYPCQPFSLAGPRHGADDPRHLWPRMVDAIAEQRPRFIVLENVRGHLSLGFDEVIRDLHWLDYSVEWVVNRAADIGAPHGRARIFALGWDNRNA